ncbi:NCK-interacting protein with SH3 domain [Tribolium madens]|uniref:NCK-interacting protein with SH3 domain n=1 Tax=Tribolium madens TaxID=41895 RepID=UPI001CF72F13|nr:NCK-interacting protein with SH3 domain [Tribolium madens]
MSQKIVLTGTLDMLHSLYDFKATYAKTLSFRTNEYFILHQSNTKHKNWWEVINEAGEMGFIPSNYVETVTVNPSFYLQFVENCLENLKKRAPAENLTDRHEIIARLKEVKKEIEELPEGGGHGDDVKTLHYKNSDVAHFQSASSQSSLLTELKNDIEDPIRPIKTNKERVRKSIENLHEEGCNDVKKSDIPSPAITDQSVYELVESVRINTQLSYEMSRVAVVTVVQGLHELLPASVFPYLSTILSQVQKSLNVDDVQIDQTHDASRLKIIFNELTSCKEDSQQRSWMLHEDEDVIKEYLLELISILSNADASISRHVISRDQYHCIVTLIQFYQMEIRWSIRQLLLQTFGVLCSLDKTVVSIMLNSILPGELARDMMANARNIPKLNYSSILLTMIFSMGEPMPITHHELLGANFLSFLLNNIEYPPDTDIDEQIPDLFLNCVISFNLQFEDCEENPVLNALEERDVAKTFTEKILLLLNREHDPVRIFEHEPAPPHALLKLFVDLLSRKSTASLFYTNDIKVLIDIVVRNVADLSPGDKRRQQYIELCRLVMRNTNYEEHRHRLDDILKSFTRIFCEESDLSKNDQQLVREISHEFPHFFK